MAAGRHSLKRQRGQAAVEFSLIMLVVIGLAAVLFQALQFERDVFNRSLLARYLAFKDAHDDPDQIDPEDVQKEIRGKNIGDLVPYTPPGQDIDQTMHYGPKQFKIRRGTKAWDPGWTVFEVTVGLLLAADHIEDTSGGLGAVTSVLKGITDSVDSLLNSS
jgi:hypothetical protein